MDFVHRSVAQVSQMLGLHQHERASTLTTMNFSEEQTRDRACFVHRHRGLLEVVNYGAKGAAPDVERNRAPAQNSSVSLTHRTAVASDSVALLSVEF
jgi:hypothetical protein